jgi:acyl-CoA dehydrogenase
MPYRAPLNEYQFIFDNVVGFSNVAGTEKFEETASADLVAAILSEAGKLCEEVLAPLQRPGDLQGAVLENGVVRTSPGFAEGYKAIAEGGWTGMSATVENGGMGLPMAVTTAVK